MKLSTAHIIRAKENTEAKNTYCSMLGDKWSLKNTWVASASLKLTERRAMSSPGSNNVSWGKGGRRGRGS